MRSVPAQQRKSRFRFRGRVLAAVGAAAALALVAAACSSGSSGSGSAAPSGGTPVKGGTAVWAEQPAMPPTYIFPYMNSANISNVNIFNLQYRYTGRCTGSARTASRW